MLKKRTKKIAPVAGKRCDKGDIADLSDLNLIYATAGTAQGPPRSFNAAQVNDFLLDICWVGVLVFHRKLRRIC
jgi:hypothetical protein